MQRHTRTPDKPGRPVHTPDRDARESLIAAATELIADHGVAATSFSTIAKRARLTPAMVHYYFRDRDQLLDALVDERLFPFISYVWKPVEPGDDPSDMIQGVVTRLLRGIERAPWIPSIWMREILNEGGLLRAKVMGRLPFDKIRLVAEAIGKGQAGQESKSRAQSAAHSVLLNRIGDAAYGYRKSLGRYFSPASAQPKRAASTYNGPVVGRIAAPSQPSRQCAIHANDDSGGNNAATACTTSPLAGAHASWIDRDCRGVFAPSHECIRGLRRRQVRIRRIAAGRTADAFVRHSWRDDWSQPSTI